MTNSQYINNVTFTGVSPTPSPTDINPGSPGVDFSETTGSVIIPLPSGITPIVVEISVPNTDTNVNQTIVVITTPSGGVIEVTSPSGSNKVTQFPTEPLPEGSIITITFQTNDGRPPENVTISVIACYTPSTATTIVTTGTVPPTVTGTTPTFTISSTTSVTASSTSKIILKTNGQFYNQLKIESGFISIFNQLCHFSALLDFS